MPRYVRLAVLLVAFYVGAGTAGYGQFVSDSALIVAAGTLAVGVAAQTVLGSLVSGLVLVTDPEFNVGDYIEWDDGSGTIQSITLRVTRVVTPSGELVTVPNTTLTSQSIARPYGRTRYRIATRIGVDYETDLDNAVALAEATAQDLDEIADQPSPRAFVTELAGDEVELQVFYWIADPEPGEDAVAESAFVTALTDRFGAAGIGISPPSEHDLQGRLTVNDGDSEGTSGG
jgi:small-conductance mechanosensitive channel